jgi:hypothetical protein
MGEGIHNGKASDEGWRGIGVGSRLSNWGRNGRREWNSSRDMGMRNVYMMDRLIRLQWHGIQPNQTTHPHTPPLSSETPTEQAGHNQREGKIERKCKKERREEEEERKKDIPLPTFIICSTLAYNCTFAANLHHIPDPGEAVNRSANSL